MRRFLHRIAEAIRREPAAFRQIDRGARIGELPPGRQDALLDEGRAPRGDDESR
jgi:hypothetical protein